MADCLSKEDMKLIEIKCRISALRETLPIIEKSYVAAVKGRQQIIDEILNLEEEQFILCQGQMLLD